MENDSQSKSSQTSMWFMQKGTTTMFLAEVVGTGILLFVGCMGSIGTMGRILLSPLQAFVAFDMTVNLLIMGVQKFRMTDLDVILDTYTRYKEIKKCPPP